jgi:ATP-dependent exoDNAse (exonuclease V) alpha subunit
MLGSRKLARLLDHAQQAQTKVVLVGDDRQLAAIDAGGGFRALRLRLVLQPHLLFASLVVCASRSGLMASAPS